jgi:hypothetical protein
MYIRVQKQRAAATWSQNRLEGRIYRSPHSNMESLTLESHAGAFLVDPPSIQQVSFEFEYSIESFVLLAVQDLFEHMSTNNLGPTRSARLQYLLFASITQAYNWIQPTPLIQGTKDEWNWEERVPIPYKEDHTSWILRVLIEVMPAIVPSFSKGSSWLEKERVYRKWTIERQQQHTNDLEYIAKWSTWRERWRTWFQYRQTDGSVEASVSPTILINEETVLDVSARQDPATFPFPTKWTPLKIGPKTQSYLTYNWGSVRSTCLTQDMETQIQDVAKPFVLEGEARETEIAEVLEISQTLTEEQKIMAEFWAGGAFTVSPPGMCMWFWQDYVKTFQVANKKGYPTFFLSGFDLAIHIFETSRIIWDLKKLHMEARPIQEIRRLYRGQTLIRYDGVGISGEDWVPYQEANFVTPPFPDFPSGHSAFSQSFANVITRWFGPTIPTSTPKSRSKLRFLSPVFAEAQTESFGSFVFPAGGSQIQPNIPSSNILLTWSTWQQMADQAGISRKYGGIHATSAHVGSQAVANALHGRLTEIWGLNV